MEVSSLFNSRWFQNIMLFIIVVNSVSLVIYDFSDPDNKETRNIILSKFDILFALIFVLECSFKIFAYGLVKHRTSYLRSPWNILDLLVVFSSVADLIPALS